jgi:hypothetical protein
MAHHATGTATDELPQDNAQDLQKGALPLLPLPKPCPRFRQARRSITASSVLRK